MNRVHFISSSFSMDRPLMIGMLHVGDTIESESGLKAVVSETRVSFYVVEVKDGVPALAKEECFFNRMLKRYEIHESHVHQWKRGEEE